MKTKSIINAIRETIVFALFTLCAICLFGEPTDTPYWFVVLIASKALAFAFGFTGYRLFAKWRNAMVHDFSFLDK